MAVQNISIVDVESDSMALAPTTGKSVVFFRPSLATNDQVSPTPALPVHRDRTTWRAA